MCSDYKLKLPLACGLGLSVSEIHLAPAVFSLSAFFNPLQPLLRLTEPGGAECSTACPSLEEGGRFSFGARSVTCSQASYKHVTFILWYILGRNHFHSNFTENEANQLQNQCMSNNKADDCSLGLRGFERKRKEAQQILGKEHFRLHCTRALSRVRTQPPTGKARGQPFPFSRVTRPFLSPPKRPIGSLI